MPWSKRKLRQLLLQSEYLLWCVCHAPNHSATPRVRIIGFWTCPDLWILTLRVIQLLGAGHHRTALGIYLFFFSFFNLRFSFGLRWAFYCDAEIGIFCLLSSCFSPQVFIQKVQDGFISCDLVFLDNEAVTFIVKDNILNRNPFLFYGFNDFI